MPARRLSVRKIKEVLRLNASGKSNRKIAVSCGIGRSTVAEYLCRAADAGLVWPLPPEMSDATIEQRCFHRHRQGLPGIGHCRIGCGLIVSSNTKV